MHFISQDVFVQDIRFRSGDMTQRRYLDARCNLRRPCLHIYSKVQYDVELYHAFGLRADFSCRAKQNTELYPDIPKERERSRLESEFRFPALVSGANIPKQEPENQLWQISSLHVYVSPDFTV